jgi:hypothetical protein
MITEATSCEQQLIDRAARESSNAVGARCAVAEYLRDWGLRDPEVIAVESRRIVQEAQARLSNSSSISRAAGGNHRADADSLLGSTAILLAVEEVEDWIARLNCDGKGSFVPRVASADSMVTRPTDLPSQFPDALLQRDHLPAQMLVLLQQSVSPVVPHPRPCEMRPQPRARLWKVLRRGYWRILQRRLKSFAVLCVTYVRKRQWLANRVIRELLTTCRLW